MRWGLIAVSAVVTVAAGAAGVLPMRVPAESTSQPPPSTAVRAMLLTPSELGSGWIALPTPPGPVAPIACGALHLKLRGGAARPAAAASRLLAESDTGPYASDTAFLYRTSSQAREVWRGVARHALLRCLGRTVVTGSGAGVRFAVVSERAMTAPRVRDVSTAAYRVTATASLGSSTVTVDLDTILVRAGRALSELSISSFLSPPSTGLERRATRGVASAMRSVTAVR